MIGSTLLPEDASKWSRFSSWAIATSGKGLAQDALESQRAKFPNQTDEVQQIVKWMAEAFEKAKLGEVDDGAKDYHMTALLVHSSGLVYDVDSALSVAKIPENTLWARGSGMEFALGADVSSRRAGFAADERMECALEAAISLDADCPGKPIIENF
jgi:ATP-dependent protease HslVU (ClpYQ) peptidase subunit